MNPYVANNLAPSLRGKKILLGITGSIAAFKAHDIVRLLKSSGAQVRVVLSESGEKFVTRTTLETLSGEPVLMSLWGNEGVQGTHHIDAARWADCVLVAPATANTLEKLARGQADDLLSTEILAFRGPVLIAPAMNPMMFEHPATKANVERIRSYGYRIIGPVTGVTSCGEEGLGRMCEPEEIIEAVAEAFWSKRLGKKLVLTHGPTESKLDPVRYLTNRSSGEMGAALAWAAAERGYEVVAICGPTEARLPRAARVIRVRAASEMAEAASAAWAESEASVFIAAAAVLDWDIKAPAREKLKKLGGAPILDFTLNRDILAEASHARRPGQFVLGFAAETGDPREYASEKLRSKGCDAIFANDVSPGYQGFDSTENAGWWLAAGQTQELSRRPKAELARALLDLIQASVECRPENRDGR